MYEAARVGPPDARKRACPVRGGLGGNLLLRGSKAPSFYSILVWVRAAFHFHPTLPVMLRAPLVGHEVVQMGEPAQKRLLAAFGMMEALHHEQLPVDGVMGLIQQGAGRWHLRVFEDRKPARFGG